MAKRRVRGDKGEVIILFSCGKKRSKILNFEN